MKIFTIIAGLLGAVLTVWLLSQFGVHAVINLILLDGWGMVAVIAFHAVQVVLSALSWQIVTGVRCDHRVSTPLPLRTFVALRCVREGINNLLPVAQIGGEIISARLLARRNVGLRRAAAATICDLTIELLAQVIFTLMGLGLLLSIVHRSPVTDEFVVSAVIALALGGAMIAGQWLGAISLIETLLIKIAAHMGWARIENIRGLNEEVISLYKRNWNAGLAAIAQFAGWALGAFEVCIILHFMGIDRPLEVGFVIEALGQAAKSAGFAVPGALGVSEGGYILIGAMFGLSPAAAIALSLIKRMREIAWGLPSLALWQWLEHRWRLQNCEKGDTGTFVT